MNLRCQKPPIEITNEILDKTAEIREPVGQVNPLAGLTSKPHAATTNSILARLTREGKLQKDRMGKSWGYRLNRIVQKSL